MPGSQKNKTKKRSNFATDSIKTLKMVHIKKKKKKYLNNKEGLSQNQRREDSLPNSPVYECHQCPSEENW